MRLPLADVRQQAALTAVLTALACWAGAMAGFGYGLSPLLAVVLVLPIPFLAAFAFRREVGEGGVDQPVVFRNGGRVAPLLIGLVVAVALGLRLYVLLDRPTWSDEMWTLRNMYGGTWGSLLRIALDDYWPPLHYVILGVVTRVADTSLLSLRLPSVLFGTATVAVMIPVGRAVFGSARIGVLSAALLAGMVSAVLYSQEARAYALLLFLSVVAVRYFYPAFWEGRVSWAYIATATLLTYTHSFSSWYFIWALMGYAILAPIVWDRRDLWKPAIKTHLILFALMLPLGAAMFYVRLAREIEVPLWWATGLEYDQPLLLVTAYHLASFSVRSFVAVAFQGFMIALALAAIWQIRKPEASQSQAAEATDPEATDESRLVRGVALLLVWIILPLFFSFVISMTTPLKTWGETRYTLAILPAICLLITVGATVLRTRTALALFAAVVVFVPAYELPGYYHGFARPALDEVGEFLRNERVPGETIYVAQTMRGVVYYYRNEYPRIGSPEWDTLVAAYAHLEDRAMDRTGRMASQFNIELIPEYFRPIIRTGDPNGSRLERLNYDAHLLGEREAGWLTAPYWMVLYDPEERMILEAMERLGLACPNPSETPFQGLVVVYCAAD